MPRFTLALRLSAIAAAAGLTAGGIAVAGSTDAAATLPNRRPVCNDIGFNIPTTVGARVRVPVTDVAADPDLTAVRLTSVFGGAPVGSAVISSNGTPTIPNDDVLVFTRTSTTRLSVYLYWTVSDGSLDAQCLAIGSDQPPSDG
jgi:hypothetical protein